MKIAVVTGEADSTIYLYEEREGWACSAQIAMRVPYRPPGEFLTDQARRQLSEFLERSAAILSAPEEVFLQEKVSRSKAASDKNHETCV